MVLRLKTRKDNTKRIFLYRQWPMVLAICALVTYGHLYESVTALVIATICIALTILCSNTANAFYWALFLVPNIRMLDPMGIEPIVNMMMALPLAVYLFRLGTKRLSAVALLGGVVLFVMEMVHDAALNDLKNLFNIGGWVLNFVLCVLITTDSRVELRRQDVFSALSTGIIMSAVMYLASGQEILENIIETLDYNARFEAFADDPNYYSLYICLAIASVLNVKGHGIYKIISVIMMTMIGFLTASKMALIVMVVVYGLMLLQFLNRRKGDRANRRFLVGLFAGIAALGIWLRRYVMLFIRNFFRRAGSDTLQGLDAGRFTTGRSEIVADYLGILGTNAMCLLFGYGFKYHEHLNQTRGAYAHNTYMDLLLSWGMLGTAAFLFIIYLWIKDMKHRRGIQRVSFTQNIPLFTMLITFMALSCLSASMFPFVLAVAFIQWLPSEKEEEVIQRAE